MGRLVLTLAISVVVLCASNAFAASDQDHSAVRTSYAVSLAAGPTAHEMLALENTISEIAMLRRSFSALGNSESILLNEIRNKWREESGDPRPTVFSVMAIVVHMDLRNLARSPDLAPAVRELLLTNIDYSMTPKHLNTVMDVALLEATVRLLVLQRQAVAHNSGCMFERMLLPKSRSLIKFSDSNPICEQGQKN